MKVLDKQYVIFLDIDGTLIGKSEDALKRNLEVISKVRSLGHKVLINTGRTSANLPKHIEFDKFFDGIVSGAGARIVLDGKEIMCRLIEIEDVKKFCTLGFDVENFSVLEGVEKMLYIGDNNKGHDDWISLSRENMEELVTKELKIEKFTVLGVASERILPVLGEDYVVLQHNGYAEIIKKAYSKAKAIEDVMNYLNLPVEQSVAMGDSLNDYDMIKFAGIGVAMGNAIPEIKNIADMITTDVNEAGVAFALENIFKLQ